MNDRLFELMQETAKLHREFELLQQGMTGDEWLEVWRRDMEAAELRMQNQLQEHIRHSKQIIAERTGSWSPADEVAHQTLVNFMRQSEGGV